MVFKKFNLGDLVIVKYLLNDKCSKTITSNEAIGYWYKEVGNHIILYNPGNVKFSTKESSPMIMYRGTSDEYDKSKYLKLARNDVEEITKLYLDRLIHWEELKHRFHDVKKEMDGKLVEILRFMPSGVLSSDITKNYEECYAGYLKEFEVSKCRNSSNGLVIFEVYTWRTNKKFKTVLSRLVHKSKLEDFKLRSRDYCQTHVNLLTTEDLSDKLFFPEDMNKLHERVKCTFDLTKLTKDQKDEFTKDYDRLIGRVGIKGMGAVYHYYLLENKGVEDYKKHEFFFYLNTAKLQIRWSKKGAPLYYSPIPIQPEIKIISSSFLNGKILIPPEYVPAFFKAIDERKNPLRILPLSYVKPFKISTCLGIAMIDFTEPEGWDVLNMVANNLSRSTKNEEK